MSDLLESSQQDVADLEANLYTLANDLCLIASQGVATITELYELAVGSDIPQPMFQQLSEAVTRWQQDSSDANYFLMRSAIRSARRSTT